MSEEGRRPVRGLVGVHERPWHDLTLGRPESLRILAANGTCQALDFAREAGITVGAIGSAVELRSSARP